MSYTVSLQEVEQFLYELRERRQRFPIRFMNRDKNVQALLDLELLPEQRERLLDQLSPGCYIKGPKPDTVNPGSHYWEFGLAFRGTELYIKLSVHPDRSEPPVCLSFHPAERNMRYYDWSQSAPILIAAEP